MYLFRKNSHVRFPVCKYAKNQFQKNIIVIKNLGEDLRMFVGI